MKTGFMSYAPDRIKLPTLDGGDPGLSAADILIKGKQREYELKARLYCVLYYATRLLASQPFATGLAILIALATVFDTVFVPKDKWALYSKGTDMLTVARLKADGDYENYKEVLDVIVATEAATLQQLVGLREVVEKADTVKRSTKR